MKILVLSDTHGNIARINHILGFAKKEKFGAIIHCGDWNTVDSVYSIKQTELPIFAVLGNADEAHQGEIEKALREVGISYEVDTNEVVLDGKKILISHQPGKSVASIESGEYDVVFHGHTHRRKDELFQRKDKFIGKTHIINPGAVSNTPWPSFAIYDTKTDKVEFIDIAT